MEELDRLFRKIYEDNVNGKLNDERFYKLSDGYEAEQEQLKQEIEALKAEVSEADTEATNVSKLIAVTKKYTRIDELTPEILNTFVDKIVVNSGSCNMNFTPPLYFGIIHLLHNLKNRRAAYFLRSAARRIKPGGIRRMTKVRVEPGICGFTTTVTADTNEDEEVVLKVSTGCESVKGMMKELGDVYDGIALCLAKPGTGVFYDYAKEHFPVHAACPVINGILKCVEAECQLALKKDASITFIE